MEHGRLRYKASNIERATSPYSCQVPRGHGIRGASGLGLEDRPASRPQKQATRRL